VESVGKIVVNLNISRVFIFTNIFLSLIYIAMLQIKILEMLPLPHRIHNGKCVLGEILSSHGYH